MLLDENAVKARNKRLHIVFFGEYDVGDVAQMVERSLSMREVPGSMPGFSRRL